MKPVRLTILSIAILTATGAFAADSPLKKGGAAFGDWQDDQPGVTRLITPEDLQAPDQTKSPDNFPEAAKMPADAKPSDKEVWGRPVGIAVAKDGSLLVTEDGSGTIWRVTHKANKSVGELQ